MCTVRRRSNTEFVAVVMSGELGGYGFTVLKTGAESRSLNVTLENLLESLKDEMESRFGGTAVYGGSRV